LTSSGSVTTGWNVKYTGIPKYDHTFTTSEITGLNSRPKKSSDFRSNSATTAVAGDFIAFGEDINYSQSQCSAGYWPPGPVCPGNYSGSGMYDLEPAPEANAGGCYSSGTVGVFVSGVGAWSWTDGRSYNDGSVWNNLAMEFEEYDMDVCLGHAAQSIYHRKYPSIDIYHIYRLFFFFFFFFSFYFLMIWHRPFIFAVFEDFVRRYRYRTQSNLWIC
jgi:hypothetical protein